MSLVLRFSCFLAVVFAAVLAVSAQETPAPDAAPAAGAAAVGAGDAPVILPEPSEKAVRYYKTGIVLWVFAKIWELVVPALLVFSGLSARMRNLAVRIGRKWFFVVVVYWVLFVLVDFLMDLPLSFYAGYLRQHAYGLSNQTLAKWTTDALLGIAVMCAFGAAFLWVPFLLVKRSPTRWWLYTGLLIYPFMFFMLFVVPIWVDPLFNDFQQMQDKALEAKILDLAESAGIEGGRVFEVNKSVDTKALNAYVTGFLQTKRIVLWDTAIKALTERELLFVMAHEMGHYVLGHVVRGVFVFSTLALVSLYVIYRLGNVCIRKFGGSMGFTAWHDVAALPLFMFLSFVVSLVIEPVGLTYSRYIEHEADRFGLELTQDNHSAATAFVKLYSENLGYPRPPWIMKVLRSSHPPTAERVDFCNTYRPWESGEPLRYDDLFER
ncbi:MAG: M48 family metallopeptidase [Candidatus Hydrogenedentes bacterium]|nr:M48 family metallopeptidase [Candidatus Hydrogenedentota bacterium]